MFFIYFYLYLVYIIPTPPHKNQLLAQSPAADLGKNNHTFPNNLKKAYIKAKNTLPGCFLPSIPCTKSSFSGLVQGKPLKY